MSRLSRRMFLKSSTIAAGLTVIPWRPTYPQGQSAATSYAANEKLNIAGIGVGGRGGGHVEPSLHENLVAVCDTSQGAVDGCLRHAERFYKDQNANKPLPASFSDYRELFDKLGKQIDAVFVATPDHHHAPASMLAIRNGKHVYCEKPLTHDIDEARQLTLAAREHKVATQLGNQGRAGEGLAAAVRDYLGRHDRPCHRGPRVDRPAGHSEPFLVAAGRHAARRRRSGARRPELGRVARPRARAAVPGRLQGRQVPGQEASISRSSGAAGGISAPGPWATSAATRSAACSPR